MLLEKTRKFWKAGLAERKNEKRYTEELNS